MSLPNFAPRLQLGVLPTPLEPMPRLSRALGGPRLWVKRDDLTGLAFGGNKTRKLEYLMAEAVLGRFTAVMTAGAVQSNHARQTAAAAARLGMPCDLVLSELVARDDEAYRGSGNVMLDKLLGANVHVVPRGGNRDAVIADIVARRAKEGHRVYSIPTGGSNAVGAIGYAHAYHEIALQAEQAGIEPAAIVHASSSGGTQAGLIAGAGMFADEPHIVGINVFAPDNEMRERVRALADQTAKLIGAPGVKARGIEVNHDFIGEGYGVPSEPMREAVRMAAECEGLMLDPVYSGKAMAGLISMVRAKRWKEDETVVFLHTGGSPALFAYPGAV